MRCARGSGSAFLVGAFIEAGVAEVDYNLLLLFCCFAAGFCCFAAGITAGLTAVR
ncbi:hypothetical protein METBIDRAFT_31738 [Metschnikowia bicuspidata var. bicuspidata NRRL YB-4993]|uniref:Uncharacterized protein n=1 Tax=Metschnikowia bicuspidata var. bicuspidata NRRL YB-4993 TaxID=869754 RepID=A0A1A0HAU5_9ASCO|nr:hypothetical protein METBIDRAFT_31738 [Metschnikowia bicuspidata var. bicuspidata NRRL YB-4993]OBA21136.1 hypothetical protein METBIDRAFT_31738 [Metschnikowia bicuspidata var. bicuspidata NRRL YB-4993]